MQAPAQIPFWPSLEAKPGKPLRAPAAPRAPNLVKKARVKKAPRAESPAERAVRLRLQERMGAHVGLSHDKGKGSFTVKFTSYEELDEIMRRIRA